MKTVDHPVNILLVDDQPARLLTYETILEDLGQNLVRATSGRAALELMMREDFAVVLLDVSMPDMDGFEVAHLIQQHPRFEHTPIIFVTGVHISELDKLKGFKLGAVDYMQVPLVADILRSKVAVLVELYSRRRQLQALNEELTRANEQLALANTTLHAEKARELERLNQILQQANSELAEANRSLHTEVCERQKAEAALKEADRHKDEFLAMLAHELRSPLAPIGNAVQLLRRPQLPAGRAEWCHAIIERQLAQLTRLVDDLLDVSRITRGKINLRKERLDVAPLLTQAVETVQPLIDERGHQLTIHMPAGPLPVLGDPARLTQALANVLSNAAKYTQPGGQITVTGTVEAGELRLSVRDNGIGIDQEQLPQIFELFTQLEDNAGRRPHHSMGIGLALVRRLLAMHGGRISAHSEGPGKGSEFVLCLPLWTASSSDSEPQNPAPDEPAPPTARRTVLVADDSADTLESLAELLSLEGHAVHIARDGRQSLERAEQHHPDVAVLDIGMPGLDGYEVARRIRAQPWGRRMTLVALTGWGQESDQSRSRDAGFDTHLVKPVNTQLLMRLVARAPLPKESANPPCQSRD